VELLPVVKFLLRVTPRIHHLLAVTVKCNVHLKKKLYKFIQNKLPT
jgi:hypothetical protein